MKIPFMNYHIFVYSEQEMLEIEQDEKNLIALSELVSGCVPEIEQVITAMKAAKVGAEAYHRRLKKRKVLQALYKLRQKMGLIEEKRWHNAEV